MTGPTLVRDIMRPPVVAPRDMWFREMVRLTRDRDTDCLAIADAGGRLVGVVTEEDLLLKLLRQWLEARRAESESPARLTEKRKAAGGHGARVDERARDHRRSSTAGRRGRSPDARPARATPLGGRRRRPSVWRRPPGRPSGPGAAARRGDPMRWAYSRMSLRIGAESRERPHQVPAAGSRRHG